MRDLSEAAAAITSRTSFFRGFNRAYQARENGYMHVVRFMANHTRLMTLVFVAVVGTAGFLFTRLPTGFLPTEDQGYCIVSAILPPGAAQPRVERGHGADRRDAQGHARDRRLGADRRLVAFSTTPTLDDDHDVSRVRGLRQAP